MSRPNSLSSNPTISGIPNAPQTPITPAHWQPPQRKSKLTMSLSIYIMMCQYFFWSLLKTSIYLLVRAWGTLSWRNRPCSRPLIPMGFVRASFRVTNAMKCFLFYKRVISKVKKNMGYSKKTSIVTMISYNFYIIKILFYLRLFFQVFWQFQVSCHHK